MAFSVTIGSAARSAPRCVRPALVAGVTSAPRAGLVSILTRAPTRVSPTVPTTSTSTVVRFSAGQAYSHMMAHHASQECVSK